LATATKDVLHIHGDQNGNCDGCEVADQFRSLRLPSVNREPRLHLTKVLAGAELRGSKGNVGSLPDSLHHSPLAVLHQEYLPEACFLSLMVGGRHSSSACNKKTRRSEAANDRQDDKMKRILTHDAGLGDDSRHPTAAVSLSEAGRATPMTSRQRSNQPTSWVALERCWRVTDELTELSPVIQR
jgi:hypothetical protein